MCVCATSGSGGPAVCSVSRTHVHTYGPCVSCVARYRLSAAVLRYPLPGAAEEPEASTKRRNLAEEAAAPTSAAAAAAAGGERGAEGTGRGGAGGGRQLAKTAGGSDASGFVAAFDEALPGVMLSHLQVRRGAAEEPALWTGGPAAVLGGGGVLAFVFRSHYCFFFFCAEVKTI